tara:strand:+ start:632 stop:1183 length:552 start_codon:yes stop_codon:yes gene_type:complete
MAASFCQIKTINAQSFFLSVLTINRMLALLVFKKTKGTGSASNKALKTTPFGRSDAFTRGGFAIMPHATAPLSLMLYALRIKHMSNEQKALQDIRYAVGTEVGEYSVDEFISHHLEELPSSYWKAKTGFEVPETYQVIDLLILRSKWDDEEVYDFTLPDDVTDYVISVKYDDSGVLEDIDMES